MADTPSGETVTPVAPSNEPSTTAAPATDNSSADVEQAKREAEQARIRANQLENELKKLRDQQAEAERKKLEENEEWKTIAEKSQSELRELREEQDRQARQSALTAATENVFKDYPAEVVDIAKTTGLSLLDDSESARTALTEKLNTIKDKLGVGAPTVTSSNPMTPAASTSSGEPERLGQPRTIGFDDGGKDLKPANPAKFREYVNGLEGIKTMKRQAGLKVD